MPDGQRIVYADGLGSLFLTDLSGNSRYITGEHTLAGVFGPISLSPNGERILYQHVSNDFFLHIWETNLDGTIEIQFSD